MLRTRVLTALLLLPLVLWAIFATSEETFSYITIIVFSVAAWEWSRLAGLQQQYAQILYVLIFIAVITLAVNLTQNNKAIVFLVMTIAFLFWSLCWIIIYRLNRNSIQPVRVKTKSKLFINALVGFFVLLPSAMAMIFLHAYAANGPWLMLAAMLLVWVADSGAYFSGRAWGRTKLAVNVSPGKSWEGVFGAFGATALVAIIAGIRFEYSGYMLLAFVLLCLVTVWYSILGDLLESVFKRLAGMKDSSHLIPGHGGILDRIDSQTSALPIFTFGLLILEKVA